MGERDLVEDGGEGAEPVEETTPSLTASLETRTWMRETHSLLTPSQITGFPSTSRLNTCSQDQHSDIIILMVLALQRPQSSRASPPLYVNVSGETTDGDPETQDTGERERESADVRERGGGSRRDSL